MNRSHLVVSNPVCKVTAKDNFNDMLWAKLFPTPTKMQPQALIKLVNNRKPLLRLVGREMVTAIKGGYSRVRGAMRYTTGIRRQRSPDGKPYVPLDRKTTLNKMRPWKVEAGLIPRARGATFILRETSQNILQKIKITSITRMAVAIGISDPEGKRRSALHQKGFSAKLGTTDVTVPARPHWGFSRSLKYNTKLLQDRWVKYIIKRGTAMGFKG